MKLAILFDKQATLDEKVLIDNPMLQKQNNFDWKLLALQVAITECANNWSCFKKWCKDQRPITNVKVECWMCNGTGDENYEMIQEDAEGSGNHEYIICEDCNGTGYSGNKNPLLEKYVDCLHFILSIGLEIECTPATCGVALTVPNDITNQFMCLMEEAFKIRHNLRYKDINKSALDTAFSNYHRVLRIFKGLGEMLGFTWEQVEEIF